MLEHRMLDDIPLETAEAEQVLQHLADLWGYEVAMAEIGSDGKAVREHTARARPILAVN